MQLHCHLVLYLSPIIALVLGPLRTSRLHLVTAFADHVLLVAVVANVLIVGITCGLLRWLASEVCKSDAQTRSHIDGSAATSSRELPGRHTGRGPHPPRKTA